MLLTMNRFVVLVLGLLMGCMVWAQAPEAPQQRTPEEMALKQTERLCRELGIKDSVQRDTIYRMHLKYARQCVVSNTRMENLQRMQATVEELRGILSEEQFHQFMNRQVNPDPRRPQQPYGRMPQAKKYPRRPAPELSGDTTDYRQAMPSPRPQ